MNKKAQVMEIAKLIGPLVAIGIVLAIGFLIFNEVKDEVTSNIGTNTDTLDEVTWTNNSNTSLTFSSGSFELTCNGVQMNETDNSSLAAGNYTCSTAGIQVTDNNVQDSVNITTTVMVNYTYRPMTAAYNGTDETINATQQIPGWLAIVIIATIGALLIGIVATFRKNR